jgi:hypothetical protein
MHNMAGLQVALNAVEGIDARSLPRVRAHAHAALTVFKAYADLAVRAVYADAHLEANLRVVYATLLELEPMIITPAAEPEPARVPTAHVLDVVLCMGALVCVPLSAFPAADAPAARDLRPTVYALLSDLVHAAEPGHGETMSFGHVRTASLALRRVQAQLRMDGADPAPDPASDALKDVGVFAKAFAEAMSLLHATVRKFGLRLDTASHPLAAGDAPAADLWKAFEGRLAAEVTRHRRH